MMSISLAAVAGHVPMERSDRLTTLIRRLQGGDQAALEPLIAETQDLAYRTAYLYLRDADLCQDVLQDVYLLVYRKIGQLRDPGAFRTWFLRIVTNRCRRQLERRRPEPLEAAPEPAVDGPAETIGEKLEVRRAFAELPERDRAVLSLREVFCLSYEEIASSLGVPVGTVRSRLATARKRLLDALTKGREKR